MIQPTFLSKNIELLMVVVVVAVDAFGSGIEMFGVELEVPNNTSASRVRAPTRTSLEHSLSRSNLKLILRLALRWTTTTRATVT